MPLVFVLGIALLSSCSALSHSASTPDAEATVAAGQARAVQPGAPGESTRVLSHEELTADPGPLHTEADVRFMQGMIAHHAQALDMTSLIPTRSDRPDLLLLSRRIEISQKGEIQWMQNWLRLRNEIAPEGVAHPMKGLGHGEEMLMPGMLTRDEMGELASAAGDAFYGLFLKYMIAHHEGALVMVSDLFSNDGAAQDSDSYRFASDVVSDQLMEIARMQAMFEAAR